VVVGFKTTYAIGDYHKRCTTLCDKVCLLLAQAGSFLRVLWFPTPIKLTATI